MIRWMVMPLYKQRCFGGRKKIAELERPGGKYGKIEGPKLRERTVHIEGMHCQNCKNRIEKHVNELDGVICKVKLNKKIAVVSLYKDVDESLIKDTIEKLDFTVVGME